MIVSAVILADQVCNIFKYGFEKLRPTHNPLTADLVHTVNNYRGGLYGTFSAHTATCFVIATYTSLIFKSKLYTLLIFAWAILVAYSRIYLGVHFPFDIMGGAITGYIMALIATWGSLKIERKLNKKNKLSY